MHTEELYRVYNRCNYDIGVKTLNGMFLNIKAGSFQMLSANDILYVESICRRTKYFSAKMLVPVDENGNDIALDQLGLHKDEDQPEHMNNDEINAMLKKSNKQIEAWIKNIEDPAELHAIYMIAKDADISTAKLKILHDKMPDKEWFDE